MLGQRKTYEHNYWGKEPTYIYKSAKPKRSLRRKLTIVFSFVLILAISPSLIISLINFDFYNSPKVSVIDRSIDSTPQNNYPVTIEEPKETDTNTIEVINNDSYWKISKRACNDGKYYLSIQSQNENKALYTGDTVLANCTL